LDVLKSIKSAFGPLDEFTNALSAESEVTASSIKAVLPLLETDVLKVDPVNDSTSTLSPRTQISIFGALTADAVLRSWVTP